MPFVILTAWMMLEMFCFVIVACLIGFGPALLACLLSACAGIGILRLQGAAFLQTVRRGARDLGQARHLTDTMMIGLAALLLIVPGFLSDIAALVLLAPRLGLLVPRRVAPVGNGDPGVIEGDYEKLDNHGAP